MKIYTKTGDKGNTSLISGERVSKGAQIINLVGCLDELNSQIGWLVVVLPDKSDSKVFLQIRDFVVKIQSILFDIGADVAKNHHDNVVDLTGFTSDMELLIDEMEENLPGLKNFILPGGSEKSARIHICRSFTRNVERSFVQSIQTYENPSVLIFLNRLSDFFFVFARFANYIDGFSDIIWRKTF
jgi:cob(I)alamin adenosyltransferase